MRQTQRWNVDFIQLVLLSLFLDFFLSLFDNFFAHFNHRYQKLDARADRQTGTIILNIKKNDCVLIFARFVHIFSSIRPNYVINATPSHTMLTCWKIWYGSFWPTCTQNAKKCREMQRNEEKEKAHDLQQGIFFSYIKSSQIWTQDCCQLSETVYCIKA